MPAEAQVIDLTGRSVMSGLVVVHAHLYYPVGAGSDANLTDAKAPYLEGPGDGLQPDGAATLDMVVTSSLAIFETFTPGRPLPAATRAAARSRWASMPTLW